ncbi:hypothetical protein CLOSTMETH_02229 [[Clostridium] methylpentosum DSM 5476]|uniref:Uncharacterized protein n=1 Tax=[Clostridium] methylpentosum DSM 5476 TaxID=537013 RepID=C0EEE4_9FIRM|nr:hypothetical protein CLOSTMETH_02229 [[Clostridium] methylpentosum DSM 5476]
MNHLTILLPGPGEHPPILFDHSPPRHPELYPGLALGCTHTYAYRYMTILQYFA